MSQFLTLLLALVVTAFLAGSPAWAQPSETPKGWSKGNKTGWQGADSPPGQVKKSGGDFTPYGQAKKSGSSKGSQAKGQGKAKGPGKGKGNGNGKNKQGQ
jgi:hypothetical protein